MADTAGDTASDVTDAITATDSADADADTSGSDATDAIASPCVGRHGPSLGHLDLAEDAVP